MKRINVEFDYDLELPIEVSAVYVPGARGSTDRYGVPLEPDDPGEVVELTVKVYGHDVTESLSQSLLDYLEEEIIEQALDSLEG